jgi:hypothetical protein
MVFKVAVLALTMLAVAASSAAQIPSDRPAALTFTELVLVRADVRRNFDARVLEYFYLRTMLEEGLPVQRVSDNPADFITIQRTLARKIRVARAGVKFGAIFTFPISAEFRRMLLIDMTPATIAVVMDDNPGQFSHRVNGTYPPGKPLSTMPGSVLRMLPILPAGLEYRFLGQHLILLDTSANVIVDHLLCAIGCIEVVD